MCSMRCWSQLFGISDARTWISIPCWMLLLHSMWHSFECWRYGSCTRWSCILQRTLWCRCTEVKKKKNRILAYSRKVFKSNPILSLSSESNSLSPQFFGGTANVTQKGRPRKQRKPMINQQQNEPLDLGTAMRMGKPFIHVPLRERERDSPCCKRTNLIASTQT